MSGKFEFGVGPIAQSEMDRRNWKLCYHRTDRAWQIRDGKKNVLLSLPGRQHLLAELRRLLIDNPPQPLETTADEPRQRPAKAAA